jgi:hypothetical protein
MPDPAWLSAVADLPVCPHRKLPIPSSAERARTSRGCLSRPIEGDHADRADVRFAK